MNYELNSSHDMIFYIDRLLYKDNHNKLDRIMFTLIPQNAISIPTVFDEGCATPLIIYI